MNRAIFKRLICIVTLAAFLATSVTPSCAQSLASMPAPGTMVGLSQPLTPPLLKGIKVYPDNPFRFDFIMDVGPWPRRGEVHEPPRGAILESPLRNASKRLIKYFLASLTIPEKDLWVNLSPYEKDRIVPEAFGQTEMGRDLLSQDYLLKQITASVIYPEGETGKKFWAEVYRQAQEKFGTTDIPVDTFNKVWITPAKAVVYENAKAGTAYVVETRLKVMLETDYLAQNAGEVREPPLQTPPSRGIRSTHLSFDIHSVGAIHESPPQKDIAKDVLRTIIIPILEKEVNEGANFAQLRQVYNSLILATWFKKKNIGSWLVGAIQESPRGEMLESPPYGARGLRQAYVDRNKIAGVNIADPKESEKIWAQYVEAFKKGAYNYIKEEPDALTHEVIPRKYFSGGVDAAQLSARMEVRSDKAIVSGLTNGPDALLGIEVRLDVSGQATGHLSAVDNAHAIEIAGRLNRVFPGSGDLYWSIVKDSGSAAMGYEQLRAMILGSLEREIHVELLATVLLEEGVIDAEMAEQMPVFAQLEQLSRRDDVKFGLQSGRLSNVNQPVHDFFLDILDGVEYRETVANTLARMEEGNIQMLKILGVLTQAGTDALIAKDTEGLKRVLGSGRSKEDFKRRLKDIIQSYQAYTKINREKMLNRLIPGQGLILLGQYYGLNITNIFVISGAQKNFLHWMSEAKRKVENIKDKVGGSGSAWAIVIGQGIERVDDWVVRAEAKVVQIQDRVLGVTNAWTIVRSQGIDQVDTWVSRAEIKVVQIKDRVGGWSNAWAIVIRYKEVDVWVAQAELKVAEIKNKVGGSGHAWAIVMDQGIGNVDAWVQRAELKVAEIKDKVGGSGNAWFIVMSQRMERVSDWVAMAELKVAGIKDKVGGSGNAWSIVIDQGIEQADAWVAQAEPKVKKGSGGWGLLIEQGLTDQAQASEVAEKLNSALPGSGELYLEAVKDSDITTIGYDQLRPMIFGSMEKNIDVESLATALLEEGVIDSEMAEQMPVFAQLEQLSRRDDAAFGLQPGTLSSTNQPVYDFLLDILDGLEHREIVANALAKMKEGNIQMLNILGVLTQGETDVLIAKDQAGLERVWGSDQAKEDLKRRLKDVIQSYQTYTKSNREKMLKRLVPGQWLIRLGQYYGLNLTNMVFISLTQKNFLNWISVAKLKVEKIKDKVGGPNNAWVVVIGQGIARADAWVVRAELKVNEIKDKVGGSRNAWAVVKAQGVEQVDAWLARAEHKVAGIKDAVGAPSNAWKIVINQGIENTDAWVTRAETKVAEIKPKVGSFTNAWDIVITRGMENVDAWIVQAELKVNAIKDRVCGASYAWAIVKGQGIENAEAWVVRAEAKVAQIKDRVGNRSNAWLIVISRGIEQADAWVAQAELKVNAIKDKVKGPGNAWFIVIKHGIDGADAWVAQAELKIKEGAGSWSSLISYDLPDSAQAAGVAEKLNSALPGSGDLYWSVVKDSDVPTIGYDQLRAMVLGSMEKNMDAQLLATALLKEGVIDSEMAGQLSVLAQLEQLSRREDLKFGLQPGRLSNINQPVHDFFLDILDGVEYREIVANTLARMEQGNIQMLKRLGVLTPVEADVLIAKDSEGLKRVLGSDEAKDGFKGRLKGVIQSYQTYTKINREKMLNRLIPGQWLILLGQYYGLNITNIFVISGAQKNFLHWISDAKMKVENIKDKVGGADNAWAIVIGQGIERVDDWVVRAEAKVAQIKGSVGGLTDVWSIMIRRGVENVDSWILWAELKVAEIKGRVGGSSNAWAIVKGHKEVDAWVARAELKVAGIKDKVGGVSNAWDIVIGQGIEQVDAWVARAELKVAEIKDKVGGSHNAWFIVMSQGIEQADAWAARAEFKVNEIKDKVGGSHNAWVIVMGRGIERADAWVVRAEFKVAEIKDKVEGSSNAWKIVIGQGIEQADAWVARAERHIEQGAGKDTWHSLIQQGLPDSAQLGGIDLTSDRMNVQTESSGEGIQFRLDPAQLQKLQDAPGLTPVIINIHPVTDLPQFLGLK